VIQRSRNDATNRNDKETQGLSLRLFLCEKAKTLEKPEQ